MKTWRSVDPRQSIVLNRLISVYTDIHLFIYFSPKSPLVRFGLPRSCADLFIFLLNHHQWWVCLVGEMTREIILCSHLTWIISLSLFPPWEKTATVMPPKVWRSALPHHSYLIWFHTTSPFHAWDPSSPLLWMRCCFSNVVFPSGQAGLGTFSLSSHCWRSVDLLENNRGKIRTVDLRARALLFGK